ncbi:hypothetical protein MJH12_15735, partial [bacterium]|nr:hypothetical protein [bacterium]
SISAWSGIENITNKATVEDYQWVMNNRKDPANPDTNGKVRGVGCLVWGTLAVTGTSDRGESGSEVPGGDGQWGPSGGKDDLHSGS